MGLVWELAGIAMLAAGFIAGQQWEREAAKGRQRDQEQKEADLLIVGPIALQWALGELDDHGSEQAIRRCCITRHSPISMWNGLSRDERMQLAVEFGRLTEDPVWQAQQEKRHALANQLRDQLRSAN